MIEWMVSPTLLAMQAGSHFLMRWSYQALLLLLATWLIVRLDRTGLPAVRHNLWTAGLIAVGIMPLWGAFSGVAPMRAKSLDPLHVLTVPAVQTVVAPEESSGTTVTPAAKARHADATGVVWASIFLVWLMGCLAMLFAVTRSYVQLRRLRARARPLTWLEFTDCCESPRTDSPRLDIASSSEVQRPLLFGIIRPVLLTPADIRDWTTSEERSAILRHEVAHLNRADHLMNLVYSVFRAVFFFHPMVRYALRHIDSERELACDESVVAQGPETARVLAEVILKVAEHAIDSRHVHQLAFSASRKNLERRVDMILLQRDRSSISLARNAAILTGAVSALALIGSLSLPQRTLRAAQPGSQTGEPAAQSQTVALPAPPLQIRQQYRAPKAKTPNSNNSGDAPSRDLVAQNVSNASIQTPTPASVGRLFGSVSDPTGALIPGAIVTATNPSTSERTTQLTNEYGAFTFPSLEAGSYNVEATLSGFKRTVLTNVRIGEGVNRQLNLTMQVGSAQISVNVVAPKPENIAPAPSAGRLRISSGVLQGYLISKPGLVYPPSARDAGVQGEVVIEAVISKEGTVTMQQVFQSPSEELARAALDDVGQWRFKPYMLNAEPIEVVTTITINFALQ
jgi:TonB family protein